MIRYSFIIPHSNSTELLDRLHASIPKRSDIETIVVPDTNGRGGGWARNQGLKQAQGEWLLFPDDDDFYEQGFIDVLDSYADNDKLEVVFFGFRMINAETKAEEYIQQAAYISNFNNSDEARTNVCFRINTPWCKMVRRSFLERYNIKFEETLVGNDRFFSLMVATFLNIFDVEQTVLYNYVHYKASQTNRAWTRQKLRDYLGVTIRSNKLFNYLELDAFERSLPSLWLEALRTGGFKRMVQLSLCALKEHRYLQQTANDYIKHIQVNDPENVSHKK